MLCARALSLYANLCPPLHPQSPHTPATPCQQNSSVKEELEEAVFLPLRHPQLFRGIRRPPRHFLLHGPPGTGKTLLVEKLAAEAGLTLLALGPSSVLSKWSGESERALALAFDVARAMAPAALFLDEVDALGQARAAGGEDAAARRLLTELLLQMNALGDDEGVFVFGATNRMADCDPALLRRFERCAEEGGGGGVRVGESWPAEGRQLERRRASCEFSHLASHPNPHCLPLH